MTHERPGIFGLETEVAVLYLPDEQAGASDAARPPFPILEGVLFDCMLEGRKAACSSGSKGGYFLENGGMVHLETFLRSQSDTPVLEVATPECRRPLDLLRYSRAFDEILEETSRRSREALRKKGYHGRIVFGKNNRDVRGVGYGCHENYLVHQRPRWEDYALCLAGAPLILLCLFPAFIVFMLILILFLLLLPVLFGVAILAELLPVLQPLIRGAKRAVRSCVDHHPELLEWTRTAYYVFSHALLFPAIKLYSVILRVVAFRDLRRHMTAFLVTRQALVGSGHLDFRSGTYELSQRAGHTRTVADIIMFGRKKTIFDLKGFLFDPLSLLRPTKKLSLVLGDSNLADVPTLIKVGTTALVIEMVEAGESFDDLRIQKPLRALREISREGPWKILGLRSAKCLTALEVQRCYLERAKAFFAAHPAGHHHASILRLWQETLDRLGDRPMSLSNTLDWVAKKAILDQAVLARTNWRTFFAWGKVFAAAGIDATARARSLEELIERAPAWRRWRLRMLASRAGLDAAEFAVQRDLYFQCRKVDLRYHELGGTTGYQRLLEAEGLIQKLTDPAEVELATREPPRDTRARVRGYYIRGSQSPESLTVNWNEIELSAPTRHIPMPDPFFHRLPTE